MSNRRRKTRGSSAAHLHLEDHLGNAKQFVESLRRSFEQAAEVTQTPDQICELLRRISDDYDIAFGIILNLKTSQ